MKCCQTCRQILKPSLGATKADVTKATERNEMSGGNGNIEFLVEWDGDWADTWEPQVNLENAQHKIDALLASGSRGAPQVQRRRNRTDGE